MLMKGIEIKGQLSALIEKKWLPSMEPLVGIPLLTVSHVLWLVFFAFWNYINN